ncbi:MAG: A/G-specific adenine glycosylase [Patescibacteria group bacterium]
MRVRTADIKKFRRTVRSHYRAHGRDFLPWRKTKNPYHIAVSEIMLQQTQVERVLNYYQKFLRRFPTVRALARAHLPDLLRVWQGLGYNRRAIFLQKIARRVVQEYGGVLPSDPEILATFLGIGKNTAGAVAAFAFNIPTPFVETNIRRAFIHFFFPRRKKVSDKQFLPLAAKTLDRRNPREWYYALMDYGAHLGRRAKENSNRRSAHYRRQSRFEGSDRQVRAGIVRIILAEKRLTVRDISKNLGEKPARIQRIAASLAREGFIKKTKNQFTIFS